MIIYYKSDCPNSKKILLFLDHYFLLDKIRLVNIDIEKPPEYVKKVPAVHYQDKVYTDKELSKCLEQFKNQFLPVFYYNDKSKIAYNYLKDNQLLKEIKLEKKIPEKIKFLPAVLEHNSDKPITDKLLILWLRELKSKKDAWDQKQIFEKQFKEQQVKQSFHGNYVNLYSDWQNIYTPSEDTYIEPFKNRYQRLLDERKKPI